MPILYKNDNKRRSLWLLAILATLFTFTMAGCKDQAAPAGPPPKPQVGYITVMSENVGLVTEAPGRLEAYRVADVRARVPGIILSRKFTEGSDVKEGQLLFQIDDAPYKAALKSAQAQLAQAQASLLQTTSQAERYKPLVDANAVSRQDYDNAIAAQQAAQANVDAARAAIDTAKINLGYAAVTAPISGRIGRALVTEGALVGQGAATELAVIQQIDQLYVNFTQSATDVIRLQQDIRDGLYSATINEDGSIPVTIILNDGTVYPQKGRLLFKDLTVDETTGQVTLRAILPNDDKLLLPGLYVRVRLEQAQADNAYLVPQDAVVRERTGNFVYVINDKNIVERRAVTISGRNGQNWIIRDGLQNGDRVMVDGVSKWQMAIQGAMQAMGAQGQRVEGLPPVEVMPIARDGSTITEQPSVSSDQSQTNQENDTKPAVATTE